MRKPKRDTMLVLKVDYTGRSIFDFTTPVENDLLAVVRATGTGGFPHSIINKDFTSKAYHSYYDHKRNIKLIMGMARTYKHHGLKFQIIRNVHWRDINEVSK